MAEATMSHQTATPSVDHPRVLILANHSKRPVTEALAEFRPWLGDRAEIVGEPDTEALDREGAAELPEADLAVVLGGDGTMLRQARVMVDRQVPLLGINFGKLGFLAEFSIDSVKGHWDAIVGGRCRMSRRVVIDVAVYPAGAAEWGIKSGDGPAAMPDPVFRGLALNDAVVNAGPPFRIIDIEIAIEPEISKTSATTIAGDGVVVSTPSGSTAYNLSAGGPIIAPGVDALAITALSPHSLAFRPIVFTAESATWLYLHTANEGTALVLDGQESFDLRADQQVRVCLYPNRVPLVHNPDYNYWTMLAHKMHWAARPRGA